MVLVAAAVIGVIGSAIHQPARIRAATAAVVARRATSAPALEEVAAIRSLHSVITIGVAAQVVTALVATALVSRTPVVAIKPVGAVWFLSVRRIPKQ